MIANPYIGEIIMFGGNFAPRTWAFCNGQLMSIAQNSALFSILGTTFGGDGRTTFALPDLRGRVSVHPGTGPGLTPRRLGQRSGTEITTLTLSTMPAHTHTASGTVMANNTDSSTAIPTDNNFSHPDPAGTGKRNIYSTLDNTVSMKPNNVHVTVGMTGGGQYYNNMQPWLGINFIIALYGVYPSRN